MANYRAIAATSATLAGLITDRYPRNEFGTLDVKLYQAKHFAAPIADGFTVFLYRVTVNGSIRNMTHLRSSDGRRFLPSLPLDLHYLITPWASDAQRQQRMLGWVMRMMEDIGQLSASQLNSYVSETDIFAPSEGLDLICDPLGLGDYLNVWERLNSPPASASYIVRMALIDSDVSVSQHPPVRVRQFDVGEVVA